MTSNFNKKKIKFFSNRQFIKYFFIFILFFLFLIFIYYELKNKNRAYDLIENISGKLNYQFINLEINILNRVNKTEVLKIINKYLNQSIFLISLNDISDSLLDLNWVKRVNLSTNFKDKIYIEIIEYKPVGLYLFNTVK